MDDGTDGPFGQVPEITVGVSDKIILAVSVVGFIMLSMTMYSIIIMRLKTAEEVAEAEGGLTYDEKLANADVSTLNRAQRRARARHIMKQQRRVAPLHGGAAEVNNEGDENPDLQQQQQQQQQQPLLAIGADPTQQQHLSRKERQKAAKAAEKEERGLFEETRKKQQLEAQEAAQREKKERASLAEQQAEEERRTRQAQRQQEELATYHVWKTFLASPDPSKTLSVKDWIQELETTTREVNINQVAGRFETSESVVVARIQDLLKTSRITGIWEEGNERFIYVPPQDLDTLASFIQTQDVLSLGQLAMAYDEIIAKK
jgi:hypothetical protein